MSDDKNGNFSDFEREAMRERAKELKAETRAANKREQGEVALKEVIAKMSEADQKIANSIHEIIMAAAPQLWPKTWYSMPAYAIGDDVLCFFQAASKFKTRYSSLGFNESAKLDDGDMWPTTFALKKLGGAEEKRISDLIKQAVGA